MAADPNQPQSQTAQEVGPGQSQRPRRVAVIAVHGVGHAEPNSTSAAVANLLTNLDPAPHTGQPLYCCYRATPFRIPLEQARVHRPEEALFEVETRQRRSLGEHLFGSLDERRGYFAESSRTLENRQEMQQNLGEAGPGARGRFGHEFMRLQLAGYKRRAVRWPPGRGSAAAGPPPEPQKPAPDREADTPEPPDESYETLRLELRRNGDSPPTSPEVHIYEVHWSDFARPIRGALGIFSALYQLLLHLVSLGLTAVDHASFEHAAERKWSVLRWLYSRATRLFRVFIPVVTLYLVLAGLVPLPHALLRGIQRGQPIAALALAFLLGLWPTYLALRRREPQPPPWLWALAPLAGGVAGAGVLATVHTVLGRISVQEENWGLTLTLLVWVVGARLILWALTPYDKVRSGAIETTWFVTVLSSALLVFSLTWAVHAPDWKLCSFELHVPWKGDAIEVAALLQLELLYDVLRASWFFYLVLAIFGGVLGYLVVRFGTLTPGERARARAALRTGRFALALPTALFLVVTVALFGALNSWVFRSKAVHLYQDVSLSDNDHSQPSSGRNNLGVLLLPRPQHVLAWAKDPVLDCWRPAQKYGASLLRLSVTAGMPLTLLATLIGFLLLAWTALPSVLTPGETPAPDENQRSRPLGAWLSRGLDSLRFVIWIFWWGTLVVLLGFGLADALQIAGIVKQHFQLLERAAWWLAATGLGAIVTLAIPALAGTVGKISGVVLDIVLDVDNYLRTSPVNSTPRARIAERYVSLLRCIANCPELTGGPYHRIVIVAHSLGALISADLLRFLRLECQKDENLDPALRPLGFGPANVLPGSRPQIYLLTFGNPLRQLLNRFFPHLYWWVRERPDSSPEPLGPPKNTLAQATPANFAAAAPDPDELNVARWVNVYRSGDFVGRSLWLNQWYNYADVSPIPAGRPPDTGQDAAPPHRSEYCLGAGAHNRYWDRKAPALGRTLDALLLP